jgi:hypothetical protein
VWVSKSHNFAVVTSDASPRFHLLRKHHLCNYVLLFLRDLPLAQTKRKYVRRSCVWTHTYFIMRPRIFSYPVIRGPLLLRNIRFLLLSRDAIFEISEAIGIRPEETHSAACQDIYICGADSLSVTGDRINGFVEPWVEPCVCVCMCVYDKQAGSHICTCTPMSHNAYSFNFTPPAHPTLVQKIRKYWSFSIFSISLTDTDIQGSKIYLEAENNHTHKSFFVPLKQRYVIISQFAISSSSVLTSFRCTAIA